MSELDAAPVLGAERISSLDVLRGVAIFGILAINIYAFAMPFTAYANPLLMGGTDAVNMGTWFFTHILVDQKFMSIFAMLFGAGIILMTGRAEAKGAKYGRIFYRRQFWLAVLGAVHGYLIWQGDILFLYAVVGILAYRFRNSSLRRLIIVACCLFPITTLFMFGIGFQMQEFQGMAADVQLQVDSGAEITEEQQEILDGWDEQQPFMSPSTADIQEDVDIHRGTYAEILAFRVPAVVMLQSGLVFLMLGRVAALMLLGMVLMKTGVLSAKKSANFYRNMLLICYGVGLPMTIFSAYDMNAHEFNVLYMFQVGGIANYFGSVIVGLGHLGLVMLMIKTQFAQGLMQRFAAVGRMALSNYLMHSVILTTIFYGYGLGLYGSIPRFQQMAFVVAVIGLQLLYSSWWLARYRFGPVEWLWRSLTYWKRQPMKR